MDILTPPTWLDRTAKSYFNRVAPALLQLGKLDPLSLDLVAAASQAYSTYRQTLDTLKDEGRVIVTPSGTKKTHPALAVEKQAFEMMCRVWRELDIGGKPPLPQADDLDEFINEAR